MDSVLIAGAGKIGALIACLLTDPKDREIHIADMNMQGADIKRVLNKHPEINTIEFNVKDTDIIKRYIQQHHIQAIISCLPYYANLDIAKAAQACNIHYFDLTEDVTTSQAVKSIATKAKTAFVPQCGLAPGYISIVTHDLMQRFDSVDSAKLRVGALPQHVDNSLQYALTWSTDGLINEYGNDCHAVVNGENVTLQPLEGIESIQLDGLCYEAFNTSGGIGSLVKSYQGKIQNIDYKTIRYPGHCEKMKVLMNDLKLNQDRETLKKILENAVPKTYQDLVLVYVSVTGYQANSYLEENYMKKLYPRVISDIPWSAIQITTAAGICAIVDIVLTNPDKYQGLILQENFGLSDFLQNRFGQYYL